MIARATALRAEARRHWRAAEKADEQARRHEGSAFTWWTLRHVQPNALRTAWFALEDAAMWARSACELRGYAREALRDARRVERAGRAA